MQSALGINPLLASPVERRGIISNGRINHQVGTFSATGPPSFTSERVRAVSAEHPGVV